MEYTKDLIFDVHYSEAMNKGSFKNRTSIFLKALKGYLKKHRIITTSVLILLSLSVLDIALIMNFISILEHF